MPQHLTVFKSRRPLKKRVPARSSFGNKCTRQVFRYLLGLSVSDTQTGLRAIPAFFMEKLLEVNRNAAANAVRAAGYTARRKQAVIEGCLERPAFAEIHRTGGRIKAKRLIKKGAFHAFLL